MNNSSLFIQRVYGKFYISTVLTLLLHTSIPFIGVFLAGNMFGPFALGTVGLLFPFLFIYEALGAIYEVGSATLCSKYIGENSLTGAKKAVTVAYISNISICAIIAVFGFTFLDNILCVLKVPEEMLGEAKLYAGIFLACGASISSGAIGRGLLKFDGDVKTLAAITAITAISLLCMLIVTYALIRYAGLGLSAIAIGINAGSALSGFFMLYMMASKTKVLGFAKVRASEFAGIFVQTVKNGVTSTTSDVCGIINTVFINTILVTTYGQLVLSAFSVYNSIYSLLTGVISGSSRAFVQLVGVMNAERDSASVRQVIKTSIVYGMSLAVVVGACLITFSGPIAFGFGMGSGEARGLVEQFLAILTLVIALDIILNTFIFLHNTLGRHIFASVLVICRKLVFLIIPLYILSGIFGLEGVYHSLWLCSVFSICVALIYGFYKSSRNKYLTNIFLIDTEAEKNGTCISFSVENSVECITGCSRKISGFCIQNRLDESRSNLIEITIVKILLLIHEYNLKDRREIINVRILFYQNEVIIRIRNGGEIFNPLTFCRDLKLPEKQENDDALEPNELDNIKMVMDMAKNVDYQRTFGVNNLTVTL